jgi:shikimate kinase
MKSPAGPIVLVGLSGAGKTVVGRLLAQRLAYTFLDLDSAVEHLAGCSIADLFARDGEGTFRDLEGQVTRSASVDSETVVSTGGGWMDRPELREMWPGAVRIWLRVEPKSAVSRLARQRSSRPLLAGPDPESTLRELLAGRLAAYRLAEIAVRTDGLAPEAVVVAILEALAEAG